MLRLYRFLRGYLKIEVKGEFSEKVLNICAANRITLWNSRIIKNGIETCIYIKDFWNFRTVMRGSALRVHIIEKKGVPIKLYKNRKRKGLYVGAILLFVFLKVMSGFVWVIDVEGNQNTKSADIIAACEEIGITEGIRTDNINPKLQREELLLKLDTLAWAALNVEGSRLTVNVTEIRKGEDTKNLPTNLKAKADGIVKKINVTAGYCLVKPGDTVKKGDILVSGVLEASDGTRFVKSAGIITAETTRSITLEREYKYIKEYEVGTVNNRSVLEIFALRLPLFLGNETQKYNSKTSLKQLGLFSKSLPIKIYTKEYRIKREENITLTKEEITSMLETDLKNELKDMGVNEYKVLSREPTNTQNGLKISFLVSAVEDIAMEEKMIVSNAYTP